MANVTTKTLWACMVASAIIYVAVAYLSDIRTPTSEISAMMLPAFALVAAAIAIATLIIRRRQLVLPLKNGDLDLNTSDGMGEAFTPFILCLVLSEAIAIFGLVLSFTTGQPEYSLGFSSASLVLLYMHRPTSPDLNPLTTSAERARDPSAIT